MSRDDLIKSKLRRGFTLVELSFAMVFIGILSITIALIINDTIKTYQRGLTLNKINTVGMDLVDDMRAAVQGSSAKSVVKDCGISYSGNAAVKCEGDGGEKLVSVTKLAKVQIKGHASVLTEVPVYGAFCTGSYTYIWNSGYFYNSDLYSVIGASPANFTYKSASGSKITVSGDKLKLLKVQDSSRAICLVAAGDSYDTTGLNGFDVSTKDYAVAAGESPEELLPSDDNDTALAIYDLSAAAPAESTASNSLFYSVSFVLGTVQGGIDIKSSGNFCAAPSDYATTNLDYCAINKFNFAAQAMGE